MMKMGEMSANLKQLQVALEVAELGKQNAETEARLAKEKADKLMLEVKQLESVVSFKKFSVIFYLSLLIPDVFCNIVLHIICQD